MAPRRAELRLLTVFELRDHFVTEALQRLHDGFVVGGAVLYEEDQLIDTLVAEDREGGPLPGAAREVLKHTHRLFDFAFDRDIIPSNPAHKLKRRFLSNGDVGRALDDAELRAIWHGTCAMGHPHGDWIRLLMLTGSRRNEWMEASRSEIDFEEHSLIIPPERYKTNIEHSVPLVGEAWKIVEALPIRNSGSFLFSTTDGRKPVNSPDGTKKRLDQLAPTERPWRIHDLRRTAETRMAALGINPDHFEAVLGHRKKGMQRIYNRYDYLDEKRAALDLYAKHLMDVVGQ